MRKLALILILFFNVVYAQTTFQTQEYNAGRFLGPINANSAYARGWTGAGSTILIIDTGINVNSPEFRNKIIGTIDYTRTGIRDNIGHGSNVASMAAGARDGNGMHGVAYDANLLIAKVTNNTSFSFQNALRAIQWGGAQGAIVANISANEIFNSAYVKNTINIGPGVFKNIDPIYGGANYYNLSRPSDWATALAGNNVVVVVSAGNSGRPYPDNPATFANATDANGNLILGGRMLVVGNWDQARNRPHVTTNLAGTICKSIVNNECRDQHRVSDFYIMAPGTSNFGASATGYISMTGTSQATPVVSGAVAIINQMWPRMKPENIVKLLLVTANKNIPNYNPNVMGQGLLDLEQATRPVGVITIPTTGRTNLAAAPLVTSGSASLAKISSVMVLDGFERDFYTSGKHITIAQPVSEFNPLQASMPYATKNNYALFNVYTSVASVKSNDIGMRVYFDSRSQNHMIDIGKTWEYNNTDITLSGGSFQETGTWLGSSGTNLSNTTFTSLSVTHHINHNQRVFGTLGYGVTNAKTNNALFDLGNVQSYTWNVGLEQSITKDQNLGLMISQPVTVFNTNTLINIPVGIDDSGLIKYNQERISLAPEIKEMRYGFYFKTNQTTAFVEHRQNYLGQPGASNDVIGLSTNFTF